MRVDVFFVGPGKCGTSWIHEYLRRHPEVSVPAIKEPNRWLAPEALPLADYHALWSPPPGTRLVEVSNTYCFHPEVAARLQSYNPEARIVFTLRDPVARLASRYLFMRRNGMTTRPLAQVLAGQPELLEHCRFREVVEPWFAHVPRDRTSLLLLEELKADPEGYAGKLCDILGVGYLDPSVVPPEGRLRAALPRSVTLARLVKRGALLARRAGLFGLLDRAKRSPLLRRLLYRPVSYDAEELVREALTEEQIGELRAQWRWAVSSLDPGSMHYLRG